MIAILLAAAIPRIVLAVVDHGILWPDEIFQSLEQAHRLAFGYGFIPWEFQEGARSWLFPGTLALILRGAAAVGVSSALTLVVLAKLFMVSLALMGIYATIRVAERLGGDRAGLLAGLLAAAFPASLVFGHRCMAESASGPVLAVAVWFWLLEERRKTLLAGLLASLAMFLRYQNGLVLIGLLVALLATPRRREAMTFVVGAVVGVFAGEILDWATWGAPFHSLFAYLRYNLIQGRAAAYGVSPWSYYLQTAWSSTGVSVLAIGAGIGAAWRRSRPLVAITIGFIAAHCFVPHKEYRFLMPVVPVLLALAAVGLALLLERRHRWIVVAVGLVMCVLMAAQATSATLASIGQASDQVDGSESVWHHSEGPNLALAEAGTQSELCGVLVAGLNAVWTGGFTYLHRDVPFLTLEDAANGGALLPYANYVIVAPDVAAPPGYAAVRAFRGWSLQRRDGGCVPPPPPGPSRLFDGGPPR